MPRPSPRARLSSPGVQSPSSANNSHSPQASPSRRGPVESSYQRTFRNICKTFGIIRKNVALIHAQGVESIKKIEKILAAAETKPVVRSDVPAMAWKKKLLQLQNDLEDEQLALYAIFQKLSKQQDALKLLRSQALELLREASERRGLEYTFRDPLFWTLPLSQLVDLLEAATSQYTLAILQTRSIGNSLISKQPESATVKEALSDWKVLQLSDNKKVAIFVEISEVELYMQEEGE